MPGHSGASTILWDCSIPNASLSLPGPRPPPLDPGIQAPVLPLREAVVPQPATWQLSPGLVQLEGSRRVWARDPNTTGLPSFSSMRS